MLVKIEANLVALAEKSFTDKEGKTVEYTECYFQTEDENGVMDVAKINSSRKDLRTYLHKPCHVTIDVQDNGKKRLNSLQLADGRSDEE